MCKCVCTCACLCILLGSVVIRRVRMCESVCICVFARACEFMRITAEHQRNGLLGDHFEFILFRCVCLCIHEYVSVLVCVCACACVQKLATHHRPVGVKSEQGVIIGLCRRMAHVHTKPTRTHMQKSATAQKSATTEYFTLRLHANTHTLQTEPMA